MTLYNVWVGGESSWNRSYMGELGWYAFSAEQISRWIPEDEDPELEQISEKVHRDWDEESDGEDDIPTRDEIENGCLGFGAYTDQTFGVSKLLEEGEEEIIWSGSMGELVYDEDRDEEDTSPSYTIENVEPGSTERGEVGIAYHHTFKGGWGVEIELPDEEEFDVRKLQFSILELEGLGEIVTGVSYDGEDYYDDNCSDGKSCDWYLFNDGEYHSL
jgi:hypothetical protein